MQNKNYSVYILWTTSGHRFYIGISEDTQTRLTQHNEGISRWTKRYAGSWTLVWQREFHSLSEARKFENLLKRQKCGAGFWRITGLNSNIFKQQDSGS